MVCGIALVCYHGDAIMPAQDLISMTLMKGRDLLLCVEGLKGLLRRKVKKTYENV